MVATATSPSTPPDDQWLSHVVNIVDIINRAEAHAVVAYEVVFANAKLRDNGMQQMAAALRGAVFPQTSIQDGPSAAKSWTRDRIVIGSSTNTNDSGKFVLTLHVWPRGPYSAFACHPPQERQMTHTCYTTTAAVIDQWQGEMPRLTQKNDPKLRLESSPDALIDGAPYSRSDSGGSTAVEDDATEFKESITDRSCLRKYALTLRPNSAKPCLVFGVNDGGIVVGVPREEANEFIRQCATCGCVPDSDAIYPPLTDTTFRFVERLVSSRDAATEASELEALEVFFECQWPYPRLHLLPSPLKFAARWLHPYDAWVEANDATFRFKLAEAANAPIRVSLIVPKQQEQGNFNDRVRRVVERRLENFPFQPLTLDLEISGIPAMLHEALEPLPENAILDVIFVTAHSKVNTRTALFYCDYTASKLSEAMRKKVIFLVVPTRFEPLSVRPPSRFDAALSLADKGLDFLNGNVDVAHVLRQRNAADYIVRRHVMDQIEHAIELTLSNMEKRGWYWACMRTSTPGRPRFQGTTTAITVACDAVQKKHSGSLLYVSSWNCRRPGRPGVATSDDLEAALCEATADEFAVVVLHVQCEETARLCQVPATSGRRKEAQNNALVARRQQRTVVCRRVAAGSNRAHPRRNQRC